MFYKKKISRPFYHKTRAEHIFPVDFFSVIVFVIGLFGFIIYVGLQQVTTHVYTFILQYIVLVSFQYILQRRSGGSVLGILTVYYSIIIIIYRQFHLCSHFSLYTLKILKRITFCEQRLASISNDVIFYFSTLHMQYNIILYGVCV